MPCEMTILIEKVTLQCYLQSEFSRAVSISLTVALHFLLYVQGAEIAGDVLEVGEGVDDLKPGDRVFGLSMGSGGFSEEAVLPAIVSISTSISNCNKI